MQPILQHLFYGNSESHVVANEEEVDLCTAALSLSTFIPSKLDYTISAFKVTFLILRTTVSGKNIMWKPVLFIAGCSQLSFTQKILGQLKMPLDMGDGYYTSENLQVIGGFTNSCLLSVMKTEAVSDPDSSFLKVPVFPANHFCNICYQIDHKLCQVIFITRLSLTTWPSTNYWASDTTSWILFSALPIFYLESCDIVAKTLSILLMLWLVIFNIPFKNSLVFPCFPFYVKDSIRLWTFFWIFLVGILKMNLWIYKWI